MEGINKVEGLISKVKDYVETRFDIIALNLQDKISDTLSSVASIAVIAVLVIFIIFFASMGAGWWIGETLKSPSIGFFSVAGFYLLIAILLFVFRDKWIKLPICNALLKKINIHEEN